MKYSSKPVVELIVGRLLASNIVDIVISPGSRNAPFIQSFTSKKEFNCYSIVDERCAGFFALGMALQNKKPVVLLCTSGSALLNYYPAVAEAFYQKTPLIVLSADRPEYCIDQGQGQTIRQNGVLDLHINKSFKINGDSLDENYLNSIENQLLTGFSVQQIEDKRPIHINVHLDEPLYDLVDDFSYNFTENTQVKPNSKFNWSNYIDEWNTSAKKLIIIGQLDKNEDLEKALQVLENKEDVLILTETTSNLNLSKSVQCIDTFLESIKGVEQLLKPDIIIQFGGAIISKKIKALLHSYKCSKVWSVQPDGVHPDIYFSITDRINEFPISMINAIMETPDINTDYKSTLLSYYAIGLKKRQDFLGQPFYSDLHIYHQILEKLPKETIIHSSNSSVIRYLQLFNHKHTEFYCNRGTSGIDGSTSTALGFASQTDVPVCLFTGDISFFYDSNAFWNSYIPKQFKVILINNSGGDIFRIIPGAKDSLAREEFFSTTHNLRAKGIADTFGLDYYFCNRSEDLIQTVDEVMKNEHPTIFELKIPEEIGPKTLKDFFSFIQNSNY